MSLSIVSALLSSASSGMMISAIFSHFSPLSAASHAVGFPSVSTALTFIVCPTVADVRPREMSVPPESPPCPSAPFGMPRLSSGFSAVPPMLAVALLPAGRVVTVPIWISGTAPFSPRLGFPVSVFPRYQFPFSPMAGVMPSLPSAPGEPSLPDAPAAPGVPPAPLDGLPVSVLPRYQFPFLPMVGVMPSFPSAPGAPSLPGAPVAPGVPSAPLDGLPVSVLPRYQFPFLPMVGVIPPFPSAPVPSGLAFR